jgi:hypothetical protein
LSVGISSFLQYHEQLLATRSSGSIENGDSCGKIVLSIFANSTARRALTLSRLCLIARLLLLITSPFPCYENLSDW